MGKHEQEKVFIAETIVNDLLNGQPIDTNRIVHKFFEYASALAKSEVVPEIWTGC